MAYAFGGWNASASCDSCWTKMLVYPRDVRYDGCFFYVRCPDCKSKQLLSTQQIPPAVKARAEKRYHKPWWAFWA